jgi:hypothetical protein
MTTIAGIPAHALWVHAIVVLAPLVALLEILNAVWPAARQRLAWLVLALAATVLVLTPIAANAGAWLYDQESQHRPILEEHAARGSWMILFSIALLVVAILQAGQHWLESRSKPPKRILAVIVAVAAVVVGVSSIVAVVRIGDAGSHAVWGDR